jgi:anti-sigma-K factor RskA
MSTEIHTLSGAYAIDALSEEEAALFRAHLEECAVCRQEVRELREAASLMGAAEATPAPPALKARVLAAAERTPQLPPRVVSLDSERRRRRWAPRLVAAAAVVILGGGVAVGIGQLGDDEAPPADGVTQVFEAPDRRVAEVDTDRGTVRVATSPSRGEMAVDASDLEPLDEEHVYQVWSVAGERPTPVALLDDQVDGAFMPMPEPGTTVSITVEPAGGSERPTSDPIVQVDPSAV